jgi:hypothetical protein
MHHAGMTATRHLREMEEAGSEGGVHVGGGEGRATSVAIVEDFYEKVGMASGRQKESFGDHVSSQFR